MEEKAGGAMQSERKEGQLRPKIESVEYCIKVRSKAGIHTIAFSKPLSISLQQTEQ